MLREEESKNVKSWKAIWEDTWEHTKQVYWKVRPGHVHHAS